MLCDICGKNAATVHLTEIIDDLMNELHLCEQCARQKNAQMEQKFGLNDLLAGMVEFEPVKEKDAISVVCPNCSLSYTDFKKMGRLGCSECYSAFKKYLGPLLKRIHGSAQHAGKSPPAIVLADSANHAFGGSRRMREGTKALGDLKKKTELQELRNKLQKAIEAEFFEEAARIRDRIKELEKKDK
ncbi:MAG: UvrB/UvrC motif-containing protein [Candidatus Omnitrophota bacterium]|nr:UvrB/UvrC motif-containing protein [Candidatus Omnitrophota bacterium]